MFQINLEYKVAKEGNMFLTRIALYIINFECFLFLPVEQFKSWFVWIMGAHPQKSNNS